MTIAAITRLAAAARQSRATARVGLVLVVSSCNNNGSASAVRPNPNAPPANVTSAPCHSSDTSSRPRLAPSASRSASSGCRERRSASVTFARLAPATSASATIATSRIDNAGAAEPNCASRSGFAPMFQPFKLSDDSSRARASTRSSSDVTFCTVAPGASRATVCTNVAFGRITRPPWMSSGVQNSDAA